MRRERWHPLLCEYPQSERINACSMGAEVLFVRLIAQADDFGNYYGDPGLVAAYLFGHRLAKGEVGTKDVACWIDELRDQGLVDLYEGERYLHVRNPHRHNRNDIKRDQRFPIDLWTPNELEEIAEDGSNVDRARAEDGTDSERARAGHVALDADVETESDEEQSVDKADNLSQRSKLLLDYLNNHTSREGAARFRSWSGLRERLEDGATDEDVRLVIDLKIAEWAHDERMRKFLRPKTLFGPDNFPGYLSEARNWDARGRPEADDRNGSLQRAHGHNPVIFMPSRDEEAAAIWDAVLTELKSEISYSSFETWFKETVPFELLNGHLKIAVPDPFTKGGIERRYREMIEELVTKHRGEPTSLTIEVGGTS